MMKELKQCTKTLKSVTKRTYSDYKSPDNKLGRAANGFGCSLYGGLFGIATYGILSERKGMTGKRAIAVSTAVGFICSALTYLICFGSLVSGELAGEALEKHLKHKTEECN
jgi:hypothetical protein